MFSDSALLFWTFITLAATFAVGAYSLSGAKARNLWVVAAAFFLAAFVLGFGFPSFAARYASAALKLIWITYPLITVLIVAALTTGLRAPPQLTSGNAEALTEDVPAFATTEQTKWVPDITYAKAVTYLMQDSKWVAGSTWNMVNEARIEVQSALRERKISSWGREHPGEGDWYRIAASFWVSADVTPETDYAFSDYEHVGVHDLRLSSKEIQQVWPKKPED